MARVEFPREERRRRFEDRVRLPQLAILFLQPPDLLQLRTARAGLRAGIDLSLPDPLAQRLRTHVQLLTQVPAGSPRRRVIGQTIQSHPGRTLTNLEGIFDGHNRILSKKENGTKPGTVQNAHRTRTQSSSDGGKGKSEGGKMGAKKAGAIFALSALATLVAGAVLELSGDAASSRLGVSGIIFGATILAMATSLPELSTGLQSIKQGDDNLAMSDIFGGNAFLPVLFLVATLISGKAVLPAANSSDIYLTAIGILLTVVYAVGLIIRPSRKVAGMGIDSFTVLCLYLLGVVGLFTIAS
jgi:hypothetical protein